MNFFEHQDQARRNTKRLVALFFLAVAGIIVALYLASRVLLRYGMSNSAGPLMFSWWDPAGLVVVAIAAILFIGAASFFKMHSLRKGGAAVAEMLGGRPVRPDTEDPSERRLRNVVEEMAIASGVPVPRVYVLDQENGINAFAAGHTPDDAAVAVTRGTLRALDRDQLQGVIAHEFSHILNGDMRLNLRMMGVLFGIFAMGIVGRVLAHAGGRASRGSRKGGLPVIAVAGLLLVVIGAIGTILGRIIQSAVSREREFLADSSAVQFTRNPKGIAGALEKIGGFASGSRIRSPKAEQASHMFFARGLKTLFSGLFATHPPLGERIKRIDPSFDGRFPTVLPEAAEPYAPEAGPSADMEGLIRGLSEGREFRVRPESVTDRVGSTAMGEPLLAAALLGLIPPRLRERTSTSTGAAASVAALLLADDAEERKAQVAALRERSRPEEIEAIEEAAGDLEGTDERIRLPLVDLAAPALRELSPGEKERFRERLGILARADGTIGLFEFTLRWLVERRLEREERPPDAIRFRTFGPVLRDLSVLLGALARAGAEGNADAALRSFERGRARISELEKTALPFDPTADTSFPLVGRALSRLADASYALREKVVDAAAHAALADHRVTPREAELLRVVSIALGCPIPPFPPLVAAGAA